MQMTWLRTIQELKLMKKTKWILKIKAMTRQMKKRNKMAIISKKVKNKRKLKINRLMDNKMSLKKKTN